MWENSSLAKTLISILNALFGDYFTATGNSTDMKLALFKKKKKKMLNCINKLLLSAHDVNINTEPMQTILSFGVCTKWKYE